MSNKQAVKKKEKNASRVLDVIVVFLCLGGVGASLYLFQNDLFRTFRSMSMQSVGVVTVKYNTVQRRMADRVVWDRLNAQSPVYSGDLIRIARRSGAMLNIEDNRIELGENSLIRIQKDSNMSQIEFFLGSIYITSGQDSGGLILTIGDQKIVSSPGAAFYAAIDDNGMILQVDEGSIQVINDGYAQSVHAGNAIIQDSDGKERLEPMALVSHPRPNARYLKTGTQPEPVYFKWSRINMDPREGLRLEIAEDYNFTRIQQVIGGLDSAAAVPVNNGLVYWRLSLRDVVLGAGRMTVTEAVPPVPLSPVMDANYYFRKKWPQINFRWSEVDDVMRYILQISQSQDFNDNITVQVQGTSHIGVELGPGKWYWRVQPVYSSVYEGSAVFSNTSVFYINQSDVLQMPVLIVPVPDSMINIGIERKDISFLWSNMPEAVSYTIQISADPFLQNPVLIDTVHNNYYIYGKDENVLTEGLYYWSVFYIDEDGNSSPLPQARQFTAIERIIDQRLVFPPDNYSIEENQLQDTRFTWRTNLLHNRHFQVSALPDFSIMEINDQIEEDSLLGISVPSGNWYWRISASYDELSPVYSTAARRFTVQPPPEPVKEPEPEPPPPQRVIQPPPAQRVVQPVPAQRVVQSAPPVQRQVRVPEPEPAPAPVHEPEPVQEPEPAPVVQPEPSYLTLLSPLQDTVIQGLTAAMRPTIFNWETGDIVGSSKFILSRRSDMTQSEVEIFNPGRTITVNTLEEGLWYWTVEAYTPEGLPFITDGPRQLHVQYIPLLTAPRNMRPASGYRIGVEELRQQRVINFSWSAVDGANMYIFTISRDTDSGLRQILQIEPQNRLSYSFNDLGMLEHNAAYIWQVEAVFCNSDGTIIQRGQTGVSFFMLDVPRPGQVQTSDTGVLYGF